MSALFSDIIERLSRGSVASHSAVSLLVVSSLRGVIAGAAAASSVASVSASLSAAGDALINADRAQLFIPALVARAQRLLVEEATRASTATPATTTTTTLRATLEAELSADPARAAADGEWLPAAIAASPFSDAARRGVLDGLDELADEIENANSGACGWPCTRVTLTTCRPCPTQSDLTLRAPSPRSRTVCVSGAAGRRRRAHRGPLPECR